MMRLGFLGTGEITSAIVTGLNSDGAGPYSIRLSPRNGVIAAGLAGRFQGISIASSNQDVLDCSETIIVAVRPQVVRSVLSELRFRPDHCVISVVSSVALRSLSDLVAPATRVTRAVPLPSVAQRLGPTALYPADPVVSDLFATLGSSFAVETEVEFDAMCAATATIASYFAFVDKITSWLARNSVPESKARDYVARIFWGVTSVAAGAPERSFHSLANHHATAGGINEQLLAHLTKRGILEGISEGLDMVMNRIRLVSPTSSSIGQR